MSCRLGERDRSVHDGKALPGSAIAIADRLRAWKQRRAERRISRSLTEDTFNSQAGLYALLGEQAGPLAFPALGRWPHGDMLKSCSYSRVGRNQGHGSGYVLVSSLDAPWRR